VSDVRIPVAVWEISAVWSLAIIVPFPVMKLSRFGICSRSDGTFGLSRRRCVLSNWRSDCDPYQGCSPSHSSLPLLAFPCMAGESLAAASCPAGDEAATLRRRSGDRRRATPGPYYSRER
jgi:hypothetical protein